MKRFFLFSLFIMLAMISVVRAQAPQDRILGTYFAKFSRNDAKVKAFKYKDGYRLQICWLKNMKNADGTMKTDVKNPDKAKRSTPMNEVVLVDKVVYTDKCWKGSKIYDPSSGRSYKVELRLTENKQLEVKGILGIFHKCMYWDKLN